MRRIVVVVAAALGLLVSAGQATAAPGDSALELAAAAQAAASAQGAGAQSGASQSQPSNKNVSVRVLSPGDNGNVTQSNTVSSNATAANANVTGQSANQTQTGSCGCTGGTQAVGQKADSSQAATALSYAKQSGASNKNIPVRVLSPGDNGDVTQTNSVESDATAANINATGQSADQTSAGGSGTQAVGQDADSKQHAAAASAAEQKGAENTNISVRVLSPGKDGDVTQSNSVASSANGRKPEPRRPEGRSGTGRLGWHPGHRAGRRQRPVGDRALSSEAGWCEEHEHPRPRPEQGRRWRRVPVEQRRLVGCRRQPELHQAVRRSGPGRQEQGRVRLRVRRHPGHRPGRQERAVRRRAVSGASVRGQQHEHPGSRRQQGRRRRRLPVEQRRLEGDGAERQPDRPEGRPGAARRRLPADGGTQARAEGQRHRSGSSRRPCAGG